MYVLEVYFTRLDNSHIIETHYYYSDTLESLKKILEGYKRDNCLVKYEIAEIFEYVPVRKKIVNYCLI